MDPYEKIRKMGKISEELKKHGLVNDSNEALKEAEQIMGSKDKDFYVSQDELKEIEEKKEEHAEDQEKINQGQDRIISQLNNKVESLGSEMSLIRNKMNEIIAKINEIESKINSHPKHEVQATLDVKPSKEDIPKEEPKENKKNKHTVQPQVKKEYNSDDVSIEKMFYAGNK